MNTLLMMVLNMGIMYTLVQFGLYLSVIALITILKVLSWLRLRWLQRRLFNILFLIQTYRANKQKGMNLNMEV